LLSNSKKTDSNSYPKLIVSFLKERYDIEAELEDVEKFYKTQCNPSKASSELPAAMSIIEAYLFLGKLTRHETGQ
jgi:hypothetical protein